jgi:RNA polymerase sigma factor (sigma-70 family)
MKRSTQRQDRDMQDEHEVRLAHVIRGGGDAAARTRRQFVAANARLVHGVARTYQGRGLGLDDLVREGNDALVRAAEQFDWRSGHKFAPYAATWIGRSMQHALAHQEPGNVHTRRSA